jgi:hypothetical protein
MQRWLIAVFAVLAFGSSVHASQPKPPWTGDYSAAKAEARQTGKPLLVVFRCVP